MIYTGTEQTPAGVVLALHCSAGSGAQWRPLAERLGSSGAVVAPDLWGYGNAPAWGGETPLALAHEAGRALASLPTSHDGQIDLVGHSYGGAVALHIARHHSLRVRSLVLIEPVAFHLLASAPPSLRGMEALAEIRGIASDVRSAVAEGRNQEGTARFVDYWNGPGAWARLSPAARASLSARLPKVAMDFSAALDEPGDLGSLGGVRCPVLVLRGAETTRPARLISTMLAGALPRVELATVAGAGHMLPITHAGSCNELIAWHFGWSGTARPSRAA